MLESTSSTRSLERATGPHGTARTARTPFSTAPRARTEGREAASRPETLAERRRAEAEQRAEGRQRRESRWTREEARGARREERAAREAERSGERATARREAGEARGERAAQRSEGQQTSSNGASNAGQRPEATFGDLVTRRPAAAGADPLAGATETGGTATATDAEAPAEAAAVPQLAWNRSTAARAALGTEARPTTRAIAQGASPAATTSQAATSRAGGGEQAAPAAREAKPTPAAARAEAQAEPAPSPERVERAAEVMRQFRMQLNPGMRAATIELAPADLGRIRVEMKLDEGKVRAVVRAEKPEALAALEAHLPELRAALEQQGLVADDLDLGLGFADDPRRGAQGDAPRGANRASDAPAIEPDQRSLARAMARNTGVDFYA